MLTEPELNRYNRHLVLTGFGLKKQEKLKSAKVLVIGAGGLGCPALLYLAAAGVGNIGIVDFDLVEESNLQRQILFNTADIGKNKAEVAKEKLSALNPFCKTEVFSKRLDANNANAILEKYEVILDGTDNFPSRFLINDVCVLLNKTLVYATVSDFSGQLSVFNFPLKDGSRSPNYRDLFPEAIPASELPNCSEAGVLGVTPGIFGTLQATEVIKVITGIAEPLAGKLYTLDLLTGESFLHSYFHNPDNTLNKNINLSKDYNDFCNFEKNETMKEITVAELKQKLDNKEDFQLIDVREAYEYEMANLGGELIPLGQILNETDKIDKNKTVIIHCKSGGRSGTAVSELEKRFGFTNLYNLKGGIMAYAREIDPTLVVS